MSVEETNRMGISWGHGCSICSVILASFFLLITAAYSLIMRLYLKAYYNSAHVAALSVLVALFVISHHLCKIRRSLGCYLRLFAVTQVCINLFYLLCNIVLAAGYIIISILSIHINFDYSVAAGLACLNVLWMLYLFCTTCAATKSDRYMDYEVDVQFVWHSDTLGGIANDMELFGYPAYGDINSSTIKSTDKGSMGTNASLMSKKSNPYSYKKQSQSCDKCASCCKNTCHFCFGIVYFFVQFILIVIFALSACHPVFIAADVYQYRNTSDLYTVTVPGHRPLALFLKCRGNGNETIVYENGLGSMAIMAWDFLPKHLSDRYTVCITDRRGYGWSETYEHDKVNYLVDSQTIQWSETNSEFFVALVKEAQLKTPFYYIGHSYGGHHLAQVAIHHPELVKALIFLDSAHFDPVDILQDYLEVVNNFNSMGIMYILSATKWFDFEKAFDDVVDFASISEDTRQELNVALRSGYYLEAYYREMVPLRKGDEPAYEGIRQSLDGQVIDTPCFVIDAHSYDPGWFPHQHFSVYNESLHYTYIPGASHSSLTLNNQDSRVTSALIDLFIQYDQRLLDSDQLSFEISDIVCNDELLTLSSSDTEAFDCYNNTIS